MSDRLDIDNAIRKCAMEIISTESKCIEWGAEASTSVKLAEDAITQLVSLVKEEFNADRMRLTNALKEIAAIENRCDGGDWDEIEKARDVATKALYAA